ncbi:MAG: hypothetical protein IGR93_22340 [Hydrococcus sp. C42_A2020_068]|uniref:hypothetical protein n=1 Tax=Pleurocapsa sp. PCC 7327 TaxID=118163 RepID=UPI00029F885D|nr:hypothetical protein [Pleurocapsa sp. PCC 7327]AFY77310.1 protein of unknown function (DUF1821) [Pleurocapsa sp. PCC 7327]MBF2022752.1 hypothetical protein [Hydrococcus sp. C42_A2020_068]
MQSEEIATILSEYFGVDTVEMPTADSWQVNTPQMRLLVILSEDKSWLRLLLPIAPAQEVQSFLEQLLEANFDLTQEVRYALYQDVLWGVFQHSCPTLTTEDFKGAIVKLVSLKEKGLEECFNLLIEKRIRQIIKAAKLQGQSLEATLQNLKRMYEEGMLGGLQQDPQERQRFLAAWQYQLERLWSEVEIP